MNIDNNGLPVICTLDEISSLTAVEQTYINNVIKRKIIPYHNFFIHKNNGGLRSISSPNSKLRIIQNFIKNNILDTDFVSKKISEHVFSYIRSRSIVDNAKQHINARWMIKVDIKNFFESINENKVYRFFLSLGYSQLVSFYLTRLITYQKSDCSNNIYYNSIKTSLPQGSPTSPKISNLVFYKIDRIFNILSSNYGYIYTRYSDDIIFSTDEDITIHQARFIIERIKNILNRNGYDINEEKTKIIYPNSKKIVTGIVIHNKRLFLNKKFKDIIKRDIFFAEKNGLYKQKNFIDFDGDVKYFINYLFGKLSFAEQVEPKFANKWQMRLIRLLNNN